MPQFPQVTVTVTVTTAATTTNSNNVATARTNATASLILLFIIPVAADAAVVHIEVCVQGLSLACNPSQFCSLFPAYSEQPPCPSSSIHSSQMSLVLLFHSQTCLPPGPDASCTHEILSRQTWPPRTSGKRWAPRPGRPHRWTRPTWPGWSGRTLWTNGPQRWVGSISEIEGWAGDLDEGCTPGGAFIIQSCFHAHQFSNTEFWHHVIFSYIEDFRTWQFWEIMPGRLKLFSYFLAFSPSPSLKLQGWWKCVLLPSPSLELTEWCDV